MNIAISLPHLLFISGIAAALYSIRKIGWKNIITIIAKIAVIAYVYSAIMAATSSVTMALVAAVLTETLFRIDTNKLLAAIKSIAYYGTLTAFGAFLFVFLNV